MATKLTVKDVRRIIKEELEGPRPPGSELVRQLQRALQQMNELVGLATAEELEELVDEEHPVIEDIERVVDEIEELHNGFMHNALRRIPGK